MRNSLLLGLGSVSCFLTCCVLPNQVAHETKVLNEVHRSNVQHFKQAQGLGKGRTRGFFTVMAGRHFWESTIWRTSPGQELPQMKASLVGVMMHPQPVVYRHSVMNQEAWKNYYNVVPDQTAPLDSAGLGALAKLMNRNELVPFTNDRGSLAYMGAIRADASCLKCHEEKKEGDLLGALLYERSN